MLWKSSRTGKAAAPMGQSIDAEDLTAYGVHSVPENRGPEITRHREEAMVQ